MPTRAAGQHEAFADLVAASGAEIEWLTTPMTGLPIPSSPTIRR